jgi:hypothetical protein
MSHVVEIEVAILDLDSLKAAAERCGLQFMENQKTYDWYGRLVGDTPLPKGFAVSDLGHCEHALTLPGNQRSYEIGIVPARNGQEGYTLIWDTWAGGYGLVDAVGGTGAEKLLQEYELEVSMRELQSQGLHVDVTRHENGEITLEAVSF